MTRKRHILYFSVAALLSALWLTACTTDDIDEPEMPQKDNTIPVEINIQYEDALSRASDNATLSVNRILILPFRKTNESLATSEPANFVPDYAAAKQITLHYFPVTSTKLNLQATSTYRIVVLGYNRNDYNFNNPTAASRLFDIGSVSTPATLANLYVKPINPTYGVPEFFSCQCIGNMNGTAIGTAFLPGQVNQITGTLKRIVSGLTVQINNIPTFVKFVTLVAENLVTATRITDGSAMLWQTTGDGSPRILGTQVPTSGSVNLSYYLLAIPDARKTLFYLDVSYGSFTERYTIKVADEPGKVSGNRFIFLPNYQLTVTGDYSKINLGFILTHNVNLDDNTWDGIQ